MNSISKKSGFTLVELLVVISIIGILAGIVYANFGNARASARDEARKVTLKELQLAIEFYKAQNDRYPEACRGTAWSGGAGLNACPLGGDFIVGLVPDFIPVLPVDPRQNGDAAYLYRVSADGQSYKLLAHMTVERNLVTSYDDEFARCPRNFSFGWCGTTPQTRTYGVYGGPASAGW